MTIDFGPAPILGDDEVARRALLLSKLQATLAADRRIHCMLARHQRLVLGSKFEAPSMLSGPTDPVLHVLGLGNPRKVTTDGACYILGEREFPVTDPAATAAAICAMQPAPS